MFSGTEKKFCYGSDLSFETLVSHCFPLFQACFLFIINTKSISNNMHKTLERPELFANAVPF